uniref:Baculovirus repeated ORF i n=1 Tax=Lymantria dispar multicapsid nuclear polyhedrosis virus TaxID=10449 RepID=A0A1B1MQV6_NPVLD|nr:baculovirus repeated ORF i [Lymantria dispar multiple nucleopolyhedrovirus]
MALQRFEFPMSADENETKFECWGVVMPDGGVACKLKELAEFLGYSDIKTAYKHVPHEWKITWKDLKCELWANNPQLVAPSTTPANWHPETLFVLEPGVYALMARSNKPMAKEKMKYVYETILPTIRKTGRFETPKTSQVVNYDAEMAEMKIKLLEAQMEQQAIAAKLAEAQHDKERTMAVYDAKLAEHERLSLVQKMEHQQQLAECKEREHQMQLQIQQLTTAANMTMTQFAVNALLAKDNIEENQQMRNTLSEIKDRVVPPMTEHPRKMEYIAGYERTTADGKKRIRVTRSQLHEVEQCDKAIERFKNSSRQACDAEPASKSKRYAWLRDSERFLLAQCPNPVAVWLMFRAERPHVMYGMKYTNKLKTEMEILDEKELREKYRRDIIMCERNGHVYAKMIEEFKALGLESEEDCVNKCLTSSFEAKERIQAHIEDIIKRCNEDLAPKEEAKTHENAGDVYNAHHLLQVMNNCHNYTVKNVYNMKFYNTPPAALTDPSSAESTAANSV